MYSKITPEQLALICALVAFVSKNHMNEREPQPSEFIPYAESIGLPVEVFDIKKSFEQFPSRTIRVGTGTDSLDIDLGPVKPFVPEPIYPTEEKKRAVG